MSPERLFNNKIPILVSVFGLTVFSALGIPLLSFTTDSRVFYDADNPRIVDLNKFEEIFIPSHTVLFTVTGSKPLLEDRAHLDGIRWLSDHVSKYPNLSRVDSLSTVSYPNDHDGILTVETYLEYLCPQSCLAERANVLSDSVVSKRLVSSDLRTSAVIAIFSIGRHEANQIGQIAQRVKQTKKYFESQYPYLTLRASGGIPVAQAYVDAGRADSTTLFLLAAAFIVILLWLFLGDLRITGVMLLTGLVSVVLTMGTAGWLGITLNSASATVPIIVLTLVIASSMHLFTHYVRIRRDTSDPSKAISEALKTNSVPIALTALTSSASLFSLLLIDSPPVRDIGFLAGIGILAGGILSVCFAPLLLDTKRVIRESFLYLRLQQKLDFYAKSGVSRPGIMILALITFAFSILGLTKITIDDDFVSYLSPRTEVRQDTDFAIAQLFGPSHIELDIVSRESSVFHPKFLAQLTELTASTRELDEVAVAVSLSDLMANVIRAFGDDRELAEIDSESLSQYFFMFEMGLRAGESTGSIVDYTKSRTHISLFLGITSAIEIRQLEQKLRDIAAKYDAFDVTITGENIPVAHLSSSNIPELVRTVVATLLITAGLLGLYFKNVKIGLNSLIAITIPLACGLGFWGWLSGSIGLAGTVVIAVALGVVIDDAIHLIYQHYSAKRRGLGTWESASYSVHRVGATISATTITLVVGLSPLLASDFGVNQTLASCIGIILLYSLAFDLTTLPKLLVWATKDKQ